MILNYLFNFENCDLIETLFVFFILCLIVFWLQTFLFVNFNIIFICIKLSDDLILFINQPFVPKQFVDPLHEPFLFGPFG